MPDQDQLMNTVHFELDKNDPDPTETIKTVQEEILGSRRQTEIPKGVGRGDIASMVRCDEFGNPEDAAPVAESDAQGIEDLASKARALESTLKSHADAPFAEDLLAKAGADNLSLKWDDIKITPPKPGFYDAAGNYPKFVPIIKQDEKGLWILQEFDMKVRTSFKKNEDGSVTMTLPDFNGTNATDETEEKLRANAAVIIDMAVRNHFAAPGNDAMNVPACAPREAWEEALPIHANTLEFIKRMALNEPVGGLDWYVAWPSIHDEGVTGQLTKKGEVEIVFKMILSFGAPTEALQDSNAGEVERQRDEEDARQEREYETQMNAAIDSTNPARQGEEMAEGLKAVQEQQGKSE